MKLLKKEYPEPQIWGLGSMYLKCGSFSNCATLLTICLLILCRMIWTFANTPDRSTSDSGGRDTTLTKTTTTGVNRFRIVDKWKVPEEIAETRSSTLTTSAHIVILKLEYDQKLKLGNLVIEKVIKVPENGLDALAMELLWLVQMDCIKRSRIENSLTGRIKLAYTTAFYAPNYAGLNEPFSRMHYQLVGMIPTQQKARLFCRIFF